VVKVEVFSSAALAALATVPLPDFEFHRSRLQTNIFISKKALLRYRYK
jgi:hypothetical protein